MAVSPNGGMEPVLEGRSVSEADSRRGRLQADLMRSRSFPVVDRRLNLSRSVHGRTMPVHGMTWIAGDRLSIEVVSTKTFSAEREDTGSKIRLEPYRPRMLQWVTACPRR